MKATVLVDNKDGLQLKGEWGLSFYIEYGDHRILLDAGSSSLFAENAEKLGLPLKEIDLAVLSHAHYDHASGLTTFFGRNSRAKLYVARGCGENCYSRKLLLFRKYIGPPRGLLETCRDRIVYADGNCEPLPGVHLLAHSGPIAPQVGRAENLYVLEKGRLRPDPFLHEQSLIFETERGLAVFNSCSHGGADRILRDVQAAFPDRAILVLVGGFHLYNRSEEEIIALAERLRETGVQQIYTGHCTKDRAFRILRRELGERVEQLYTGLIMEF